MNDPVHHHGPLMTSPITVITWAYANAWHRVLQSLQTQPPASAHMPPELMQTMSFRRPARPCCGLLSPASAAELSLEQLVSAFKLDGAALAALACEPFAWSQEVIAS